jgi:hypothetical protein
MKKLIALFTALILLMMLSEGAVGQIPLYGRWPSSDPVQFQYSVLTTYPPLTTGMSFDVLIGYIYFDSLARTAPLHAVDSFYRQLGYSDTLWQAVKYIYEIDDFNPVIFSQYLNPQTTRRFHTAPAHIPQYIFKAIQNNYPDSLKTTELLYSADYILDVIVEGTSNSFDSARHAFPHATAVECAVVDTIKGRVWPMCVLDSFSARYGKIRPQATYPCLQFSYSQDWPRKEHADALPADSGLMLDHHTWIQQDSEYIIFLQLTDLGRDSTHNYSALNPLRTANSMAGMYPVRAGFVYDPNDDFGFGSGLTVAQFKNRLRSRIYSITHP